MIGTLTREQAQAAVATVSAERDTIQANILELDGSFGKRLLAGATLSGASRNRWDTASAALATLWDTFTAYSAVIDRAAEILEPSGRLAAARLEEVTVLLLGPSVRLARATAPLGQRELTAGGEIRLTLAATVREMRGAFAEVTAVTTAAETVWNEVSEGLRQAAAAIDEAKRQQPGLAGDELTGDLAQAETTLRELRELLNSDPLALWQNGKVSTDRVDRLRKLAATVTARAGELARLRLEADQRIAEVAAAVSAAQAAVHDATAARDLAAVRIAAVPDDPLPDISGLAGRLAGLTELKAAARWTRLASELDLLGRQADAAAKACREAERVTVALVDRRNELRGLLDAYRAKAGGLGAAEDTDLAARYQQARDLLWTAPCDLAAATAAVSNYQQAVLRIRPGGGRS